MKSLAVAALWITTASAAEVSIIDGDSALRTVNLAALPQETITVHDATDGGMEKTFRAVRVEPLLPKEWHASNRDIGVRCNDGWLARPTGAALARALLATDERDATGRWQPIAPPRGPVFVIWPDDGKGPVPQIWWAWGAAVIERLPVEKSLAMTPQARRGEGLFRQHCESCHEAGGVGGRVGWNLATPPIFSYRSESYIRRYLDEPRALAPYGHMPSFRGKVSPEEVGALLAFLRLSVGPPASKKSSGH